MTTKRGPRSFDLTRRVFVCRAEASPGTGSVRGVMA